MQRCAIGTSEVDSRRIVTTKMILRIFLRGADEPEHLGWYKFAGAGEGLEEEL